MNQQTVLIKVIMVPNHWRKSSKEVRLRNSAVHANNGEVGTKNAADVLFVVWKG
jgi:hypothetical protein